MNTNRLIDELLTNLDVLQTVFFDRYNFRILEDFTLNDISNFKKEVNDFDSLRLRITDLTTQIIENFNKKNLDKNVGFSSKGSIDSLQKFLKHNFYEDTVLIEENIYTQLWAVYNVRTNFAHKKNRNYKKALSILAIQDPNKPECIWNKCIEASNKAIENTIALIMKTPEKEDYLYFEELTIKKLKSDYKRKIIDLINDYPNTKPYLSYLIYNKSIAERELAKIFNHELDYVRSTLYPVIGAIILYKSKNDDEIQIYILDEIKYILTEVLKNNEN